MSIKEIFFWYVYLEFYKTFESLNVFPSAICVYRSEGVSEKGGGHCVSSYTCCEGDRFDRVIWSSGEPFRLPPGKPEYDTRAPGATPLPRSKFILLSFVFMNCMNSRRNNEI